MENPRLLPRGSLSFYRFLLDNHLQMRGHVLVQLYRNRELADALERLVELNLAAVDAEAFFRQRITQVARSDRAEKLIVFAGAALEGQRHAIELFGQQFR